MEDSTRKDRLSSFELQISVRGRYFLQEPVLSVTLPVLDGELVWKVSYFVSGDHFQKSRYQANQEVLYPTDNMEGVAAFVEGFMDSNYAWDCMLIPIPNKLQQERRSHLAKWEYKESLLRDDDCRSRILKINGMLKALMINE